MTGCAGSGSESSDNNLESESTTEWTEEKIVSEVIKLEEEYTEAVQTRDYERFAACFEAEDEEVLKETFDSAEIDYDLSSYDKVDGFVVDETDGLYVVNINYYTVSGTHPETTLDGYSFLDGFRLLDNELKLVTLEDTDRLNEHLFASDVYPKQFMDARAAKRNVTMLNSKNYMYLHGDKVYEGCTQTEMKFVYQNEDGSIDVMIWTANGTDQDIYYSDCTIKLYDDELGTIFDTTINYDQTIPAHSSATSWYTISADEVLTGTDSWTAVHSDVTVNFD